MTVGQPRVIVLDIETAPNIAQVWQLFKTNVGINQIQADDFILTYAYKVLGEEGVASASSLDSYRMASRADKSAYRKFIRSLRDILDLADVVIAHNGRKFDLPWIIGQCVEHNVPPPSPFKVIDTLTESRKAFRLPSYKLEYMTRRFKCHTKSLHNKYPGHLLWSECLAGNEDAWSEMEAYNRQDVLILEELYLKIRAYLPGHINHGVYSESEEHQCPTCGGSHLHRRGYYYTGVSKFQQYVCLDCKSWSRGRTNLLGKESRKALLTTVR